jgi:hypothetical protein
MGKQSIFLASMRCLEIEQFLENLGADDYDQDDVSPQDDYNCIAYALGEKNKPWWPSMRLKDDYEWPPDLPRQVDDQETLDNFILAFQKRGYKVCKNGRLKSGIEKVAIFTISNVPKHAALQLESGIWGSKCGGYEDIKHFTLSSVEGKNYGKATVFLHRRRDRKPFLKDQILSIVKKLLGR